MDADTSTVLDVNTHAADADATDNTWYVSDNDDSVTDIDDADFDAHADANDATDIPQVPAAVVEAEDADTSTDVDVDATDSDDNCNVADNEYAVMLLQSSRRMPMVMTC